MDSLVTPASQFPLRKIKIVWHDFFLLLFFLLSEMDT